jgi:hypothetical protein
VEIKTQTFEDRARTLIEDDLKRIYGSAQPGTQLHSRIRDNAYASVDREMLNEIHYMLRELTGRNIVGDLPPLDQWRGNKTE